MAKEITKNQALLDLEKERETKEKQIDTKRDEMLKAEGIEADPVTPEKSTEDTAEQKAVEEARAKYSSEINKYKKEVKIWDRMKHYLTPEKKHAYINEKYPDVAVLKEAYDKARVELGNKMYADQKAELEKTLKDPELTEKLTEYKESEIKLAIHFNETIDKTNARIDKLPSKRRELLNKAMSATSSVAKKGLVLGADGLKKANETKAMKIYKQIGDFGSKFKWGHVNIKGYELTIGKLGRSAALGAVFGYAGAARYGIKLLRGTAVAMGGGIVLSKMAETHKTRLEGLENQKNVLEASLASLSGTELMLKQEEVTALENRMVEENTSYMKKNALVVAAMFGTNYASAKIENAMFGHGTDVTGESKAKVSTENKDGGNSTSDSTVNKSDTLSKQPIVAKDSSLNQQDSTANIQKDSATIKINPSQADSTSMNQQDSTSMNQQDSATQHNSTPAQQTPDHTIPKPPAPTTNGVPQEAVVRQGEGVTYALKHQLEANTPKGRELAAALGYDKATDKVAFLADLGKKLGYINEHGDVRVQANMGAAYVLETDANGNPFITEYQNSVAVTDASGNAEVHHVGDKFEDASKQEGYERYNANKAPTPNGGKSIFDGPAESIAPKGIRVEGSANEFAGEATGIGNHGTGIDDTHHDMRGGNDRNTMNDGTKPLSTNGVAEDMARRAGGTSNLENAANSSNVNIESTEQFINTKTNILDKDFSRWFTRGSVSKEWAHVRNTSMDELTKPGHEFASRGEAKGVTRLLTEARNAGVDYRGKTADQLVNELVKRELVK